MEAYVLTVLIGFPKMWEVVALIISSTKLNILI